MLRERSHIFDIQPDVRVETFTLRENKSSKGSTFLIPSRPQDRSVDRDYHKNSLSRAGKLAV
jgi:hypothetical protein